jgi:hypothetical protein
VGYFVVICNKCTLVCNDTNLCICDCQFEVITEKGLFGGKSNLASAD